MEWQEEVNSHAHRSLSEMTRNKVKLIPLTRDTMLLSKHLSLKGQAVFSQLKTSNTLDSWDTLNEVTLARIVLFNRRRQGEVSKMTISDFESLKTVSQENIRESLAPLEQKLCERLKRVEIIGKRGRIVPVIFTHETTEWVTLLLEKRRIVGVHGENKYLFARRGGGSKGHIRGCDVLRKASLDCGAERPELLRSTKLRKQIGTLSQILNLRDNELDVLANFLGHDIRVHREYYRLPEETIQVAKVSKILLSLEKGNLHQQSGKGLDDVDVDLDEEIELDEAKSDSEHEEGEAETESNENRKLRKKNPKKRSHTDIEDDIGDDDCIQPKRRNMPTRKPWTEKEKESVFRHFRTNICLGRLPGKRLIDACLKAEPNLKQRTWKNVKDFIRNQFKH